MTLYLVYSKNKTKQKKKELSERLRVQERENENKNKLFMSNQFYGSLLNNLKLLTCNIRSDV